MIQVTFRGLVQALLFCSILVLASIPRSISPGMVPPGQTERPEWTASVDPGDPATKKKLAGFIASTYRVPEPAARRIVQAAYKESVNTGLSPLLLLAVMAKESSFQPKAQSGYGAVGLMQVVPRIHQKTVAKLKHPAGLRHPESNIQAGAGILRAYLKGTGGNLNKALKRYSGNATNYAPRVRGYWSEFRTIAAS